MNHKQQAFVTQYLKFGNQMIAYKNAYQSKADNKTLQSAANRLMNHPEVSQAIYDAEARIRADVERQVAARRAKEILTIEEKLILLQDIATGNIYVEQHYKGKNCTQCSQNITSTINQRLAALRDHSKLAGHYPHKQNGKWIIPALAEQQQQQENTEPEKKQQNTTNEETPILFLGGDIGENAEGINSPIGVVDSQKVIIEKTSTTQHNTRPTDPPVAGRLATTEPDTNEMQDICLSAPGVRIGGQPDSNTESHNEKTQQNTTNIELSPAGGGGAAGGGTTREEQYTENLQQNTRPTDPPVADGRATTELYTDEKQDICLSASGVRVGGHLAHENHRNLSWNLATEQPH